MIDTTKSRGVMVGGTSLMIPGVTRVGPLAFKFNDLVKMMFRNNEQGFVYDPNDLSTLYQDAAGTIPVTAAGQPVGLMLDKSKGLILGSERINGGDFTNGLIGTITEGSGSVSAWEINNASPISGISDAQENWQSALTELNLTIFSEEVL